MTALALFLYAVAVLAVFVLGGCIIDRILYRMTQARDSAQVRFKYRIKIREKK